jgi:phage FluMu gp28-like protein
LRIEQVKPTEAWYLENFPSLKADFEDGMILLPTDDDLLGDLALVKMIRGVPPDSAGAHRRCGRQEAPRRLRNGAGAGARAYAQQHRRVRLPLGIHRFKQA